MNGSKLLQLIKSLDRRDIQRIGKFVHSPFFNTRDDVRRLFDYIEKNLDTPVANLRKEKAFSYIFPKEKVYDGQKLLYAMSFLLQNIRRYLLIDAFENDDLEGQKYLLQAFRVRSLNRFFEKGLKEAREQAQKQPLRHAYFHHSQYRLLVEEYEFQHRYKRASDLKLQESSDELMYFYIADMLRQACAAMALRVVAEKNEYETPLLEAALHIIKEKNLTQLPAIGAYYYAYLALKSEDTEGGIFQSLKAILVNQWQAFPTAELRDLYLVAINYCIRRINRGIKEYEQESLSLYKFGLEQSILFENNTLTAYTYFNILNASLKVGEYAWGKQFLDDYKGYLLESERENVYSYCMANFHFRQKNYETAMLLLQKITLREVLFNLDARRMLMRIYYDFAEWAALNSLLVSTKTYIDRQKNMGYGREHYLNLIVFLKKMLKIDIKDPKARSLLKGEIEAEKAVAEKEWLLEKLK
ncbi:MAG: hypothetical protein JNL70_09505 [Saprospiraceae bacterium]|nr:hypothetical protein [Saprospiraceae bacterium]